MRDHDTGMGDWAIVNSRGDVLYRCPSEDAAKDALPEYPADCEVRHLPESTTT